MYTYFQIAGTAITSFVDLQSGFNFKNLTKMYYRDWKSLSSQMTSANGACTSRVIRLAYTHLQRRIQG